MIFIQFHKYKKTQFLFKRFFNISHCYQAIPWDKIYIILKV